MGVVLSNAVLQECAAKAKETQAKAASVAEKIRPLIQELAAIEPRTQSIDDAAIKLESAVARLCMRVEAEANDWLVWHAAHTAGGGK